MKHFVSERLENKPVQKHISAARVGGEYVLWEVTRQSLNEYAARHEMHTTTF